jgi:Outer membrane protein beta-barrel domain
MWHKNLSVSFSFCLISSCLYSLPLYADGVMDFYQQLAKQRYFDSPQSARDVGLAGSSVSTSQDSSNVLGNPAGLGFMRQAEVSTTYGRDFVSGRDTDDYGSIEQDIDSGYVVGAFPIAPTLDGLPALGNVGFGWSGFQSSVDDVANTETEGYRLHAAYAKALSETLSLGYSFAYVTNEQDSSTHKFDNGNGYRHALGVEHLASHDLTLGSTAFVGWAQDGRHSLPSLGGKANIDLLSYGLDFGAAYRVLPKTTMLFRADFVRYETDAGPVNDGPALDLDEYGHQFGGRVGVEQGINDWLTVRAGYRYQANTKYQFDYAPDEAGTAKYNAVSFGAGVEIGDYARIDYGAEYRAVGADDWSHYVTVSVPFSICREDWAS